MSTQAQGLPRLTPGLFPRVHLHPISMVTLHPSLINPYRERGYGSRGAYLDDLREQYGAERVDALLTVLPPSEDFDGLVTELEDGEDYMD